MTLQELLDESLLENPNMENIGLKKADYDLMDWVLTEQQQEIPDNMWKENHE